MKNPRLEVPSGHHDDIYFFETRDGSPTISLSGPESEKMHHMGGAFTETLYIYGEIPRLLEEQELPRRLVNVGLGLGYIELLIASAWDEISLLVSHEKEMYLTRYFLGWLEESSCPAIFKKTYDEILRRYSVHFQKKKSEIKWNLRKWKNEGTWILHETLDPLQPCCDDFSGVFFDPFSAKSNASLWTEENLNSFLESFCGEGCVFSTYASTGSLKRALKSNGFSLLEKPGFQGKRESTLAVREESLKSKWNRSQNSWQQ